MPIRRVIEELEARLEAADGSRARGKAEWKRFGSGTVGFDLQVRGLDAADGTAEVRISGASLVAPIAKGRISIDVESPSFAPAAGDEVQIVIGGTVRLAGRLVPD